jgi:ABC-type sugar transport system, permease component
MKKIARKSGKFVYNIGLMVFSIGCIFPIIWIIYSSFKTKEEFMLNIVSLPNQIQFDNYIKAWVEGKLHVNFVSSLLNSVVTVFFVIFLSFCVGYVLSRYKFRGRNFIYTLFLVGMMTPIYALIVPLFIQMQNLHMENKFYTLIIPYIAIRLPLSVFLFESFVKTIPVELEEAAYMDGATPMKTMFSIILPLSRPIVATVLILSFLDTWNEFPFALTLVSDKALRTIPVALTNFQGQFTTDYTTLMAALVISSLPVIIVYLCFSKKIIQGMTAGAVKG